jgi:hypothetical protein
MFMGLLSGINLKRLIAAILAVFVYIFLSDMIIHGWLLAGAYAQTASAWRSQEQMQAFFPWMLLGQFIIAKYFVWIFAKGYEGKGIGEGIRFGSLIGLFSAGGSFVQYAVYPISLTVVLSWCALGLIQSILGGVLVSLVYKR